MNVRALTKTLRSRRLLLLIAPAVIGILVLALGLNVLTALAFGDLVVTFTTSPPATINAGESYSFTVEVTNNAGGGQPPAEAVVFEYRPPPDVAVTAISSSLGPCEAGTKNDPSDPATCALGNMDPGQSATIDITVLVDETVVPGTMLDNDVRAWQFGTEDDPPDNENHAFVEVILGPADMRITKFGNPEGEVRAGELLTYTIVVDNLGPSVAPGVVVTDELTSDLEFVLVDADPTINGRNATCTPDPNGLPGQSFNQRATITCTLNEDLEPLSPTDSGRWMIEIVVTADETQDIINVAEVESSRFDPDLSNNLSIVEHDITDVSDLEISKTAVGEVQVADQPGLVFDITTPGTPFPEAPNYTTSPDQATAGRRIQYTLVMTNTGPSTAENVLVVDRLPAGVTIYPGSLVVGQGNCNTGTPGEPLDRLTCGLGTLPPDGSTTIQFQVLVDPSVAAGAVLDNETFIISDIFDPDNSDNYAHTLTTVNTWADMSITKLSVGENVTGYDDVLRRFIYEDLPGQVTAGHELRYEITVQNNGASDAQNVQILDLLPGQSDTGLTHDPVTFLQSDGAYCRPLDEQQELGIFGPGVGQGKFGQVLWCNLGTVPAGARKTFDIYVHVDPAVPDGFTLTNGAYVWWGESSPPAQPDDFLPFPFPQIPPELPTTDDPFLDNNFAATDTTVNAVADVFVRHEVQPDLIPDGNAPASLASPSDLAQDGLEQAIAGTERYYLITFGNEGPSVAQNVVVTDTLDLKEVLPPPILGERFVRCESVDPDDIVECETLIRHYQGNAILDGLVRLNTFQVGNDTVVSNGTGTLNPGDAFSFYLVTQIDSGYVLDADDLIAENTAYISTTTTDFHTENNQDTELTQIVAEADLAIDKTDIFGNFLECDPVVAGGTCTYTITVDNLGPSDAAQVYVVDWLPPEGLILDPNQIDVQVSNGQVVEVRDDGRITVILGNDPNNRGLAQLGRMNVGSTETVTIVVQVGQDAPPGVLVNQVQVETRQNDTLWPPAPEAPAAGMDGGPRTPTTDPNLTNNQDTEQTTVVAPSITVNKTVSLDGTCPGTDNVAIGFIGEPVTYCYEITNSGDTYLQNIHVVDTVRTRSGPFVIYDQTFDANPNGDPNLPLAPGDSFIITNTVPDLDILIDCNDRPDTVVVTADPVNRGRTRLTCVPAVEDQDDAVVETPCKGVDWRLQLPALNTDECDTWIQVQNVGNEFTKGLLVLWGDSGFCPPQSFGPLKVECTGLLRPGSAWSFSNDLLPMGARSGIMYSLNATDIVEDERGNERVFADMACNRLFPLLRADHDEWVLFDRAYRTQGTYFGPLGDFPGDQLVLEFGAHQGEPLAVTVNRTCPDAQDPNMDSSAAYVGISTDREGIQDPRASGFAYYAPLVWADFAGLNSILHIQNSGTECTSIEMWFQQQGNCIRPLVWDILALAPGESIAFDPNEVVGPGWQGSVWLSGSQPLGIIVDTLGANHFGAYHGVPADVYVDGGSSDFSLGTQVNYAPLIYREHQGWETAIQVQNLSSVYNAKVKVTFTDNSGDIIKTIVDWICPRGAQTFFLPVIAGLPGNWVGSARIESQDWFSPGDPLVDSPRILSVVMLEKYTDPAKRSRQETVVYNALQEMGSFDWQQGPTATSGFGGSTVLSVPFVAKQNRGVTSELAIQNLNPNPGFTDFVIYIYDQNRLLDQVCEKLSAKQVEYIDLDQWGYFPPGYMGSMVIAATYTDQIGGAALGAVAVERIGRTQSQPDIPGDESKAFEAFPLYNRFKVEDTITCPGQPGPCTYTLFGQVTDALDGRPVVGATVSATADDTTVTGTTDANGRYALAVPANQGFTVIQIAADGYRSRSVTVASADCLETLQQSLTLQPLIDTVTIMGRVENKATGDPVAGATVQAVNCAGDAATTTAADGTYTLTLAFADACTTWVTASAEGFNPSAQSVMIPNGDTAILDFQLKQTPTSRVLLYYGNGGVGPTDEAGPETDYATLQDFYESLGFIVDYTDVWPTAPDWPSVYRLVILLAPGHDSGENLVLDGFTANQKARLGEFLQAGGHLVVLSDHSGFTGQAVENDLLAGLPVDLAFNSNSWADGFGDQITPDCVTDGVGTIDADRWTDVTSPGNAAVPGALVLQNASANPIDNCPNCAIVMSDVPAPGNGRVTIVGDLNFADDASRLEAPPPFRWSANNTQLIFNFLACP